MPEPVVAAVIDPDPEMERRLPALPIEMSPPVPPPGAAWLVLAVISESRLVKTTLRSRGLVVLIVMAPAWPVLEAAVLSLDV
ncbi:MAG: hypothetical protein ACK46L_00250, partial [Synechococcaceae cyanobacterium]